jgi:hypothetical protein
MELMSTAGVVEAVDDKSELTAEVELIASTYVPGWRHGIHANPWTWVIDPDTGEWARNGSKIVSSGIKLR